MKTNENKLAHTRSYQLMKKRRNLQANLKPNCTKHQQKRIRTLPVKRARQQPAAQFTHLTKLTTTHSQTVLKYTTSPHLYTNTQFYILFLAKHGHTREARNTNTQPLTHSNL